MNLEGLKVGDKIIQINYRYFTKIGLEVAEIERETKTQYEIKYNRKIRKKDGIQIGTRDNWHGCIEWQKYDKKSFRYN